MPGGEKPNSSLRRPARYFQARCQRTWNDTWHALGARMGFGTVFAICVAVVTCAIDYYAGRPEGMTRGLYSVLLILAATLAAFAMAFFVYLLSSFFAAPSRIYRED